MKKTQLITLIKEVIASSKATLRESVKYDSTIINGKTFKSEWAGVTSSRKEFMRLIQGLPETLQSIKVPIEAAVYLPKEKTFEGPITDEVKSEIIDILERVSNGYEEQGKEVVSYGISSYRGVGTPERHNTDPAYIQIRTKASERIGKGLSRGDYGPLD